MPKNLERLAVEHEYYCNDSNYYSNEAEEKYETMTAFLDDYEDADIDMNLVFRFDIREIDDGQGIYEANIFIMKQRKGIFSPISIALISEGETERLENYLKRHWTRLQQIWQPISNS